MGIVVPAHVVILSVWIVAMAAGLSWARWIVAAATALTLATSIVLHPAGLAHPSGWCALVVLGLTPWLVAGQRTRHERLLKRAHGAEAVQLIQLQERSRTLTQLQSDNQHIESQITKISDLYHVTKETAKAMRFDELFAFSLELLPKLLDVQGWRLVDLSRGSEPPVVLRARRGPDGRLIREPSSQLLPAEAEVISRVEASRVAGSADGLSWAPLWNEQKPIGVAIADHLPPDQVETLSIVANQLSLQLARIRLYETLEAAAVTDTLTGIFVRRYFLELAGEELQRSKRHGLPCSFLMVDLDLFKAKNDTCGHLVGDVVLREVAQLLRKNLRGIDFIARYGGEEFILLLIETEAEQALAVAERLRQLVEVQPIRAYDETLSQTVSIGLACFPEDGHTLQELIDHSDHALYAAKRAGRNRVMRWSGSRLPAGKRA